MKIRTANRISGILVVSAVIMLIPKIYVSYFQNPTTVGIGPNQDVINILMALALFFLWLSVVIWMRYGSRSVGEKR